MDILQFQFGKTCQKLQFVKSQPTIDEKLQKLVQLKNKLQLYQLRSELMNELGKKSIKGQKKVLLTQNMIKLKG